MRGRVLALCMMWIAAVVGPRAAQAQDLLMARSVQQFPEAMLSLQDAIRDRGYTVSRVQRVDIGLTKSGFKTDKYRVVFFGKNDEIQNITAHHPDLSPYLPLQVAIFAEGQETLLVAAHPARFKRFFPGSDLQPTFDRWERDLQSIFETVRKEE